MLSITLLVQILVDRELLYIGFNGGDVFYTNEVHRAYRFSSDVDIEDKLKPYFHPDAKPLLKIEEYYTL